MRQLLQDADRADKEKDAARAERRAKWEAHEARRQAAAAEAPEELNPVNNEADAPPEAAAASLEDVTMDEPAAASATHEESEAHTNKTEPATTVSMVSTFGASDPEAEKQHHAVLPATDDKEMRASVHKLIREFFSPKLDTETIVDNENNTKHIRVFAVPKGRRGKRKRAEEWPVSAELSTVCTC